MTDSHTQLKAVYEALSEKQGHDIRMLDIREISTLGDYLVITHGNSQPQVDALTDAVQEAMGKLDIPCRSLEGQRSGRWVLLDYGDLIINVFARDERQWYDLERLWRDGRIVLPDEL